MRARVEIEIDRLVLDGFGSSSGRHDGETILNAIQDELEKIIIRENGIEVNNSVQETAQIHIRSFNPHSETDLKNVGTQIAHTIYSS